MTEPWFEEEEDESDEELELIEERDEEELSEGDDGSDIENEEVDEVGVSLLSLFFQISLALAIAFLAFLFFTGKLDGVPNLLGFEAPTFIKGLLPVGPEDIEYGADRDCRGWVTWYQVKGGEKIEYATGFWMDDDSLEEVRVYSVPIYVGEKAFVSPEITIAEEMVCLPPVGDLGKGGEVLAESKGWSYSCDPVMTDAITYRWTSPVTLSNGASVFVEADFEDVDLTSYEQNLLFRIYFAEDYLQYLYVDSDGSFIPDLTYFDEIGPMETYPGGYPAFEQELNNLDINWVALRAKLKSEFILLYQAHGNMCEK